MKYQTDKVLSWEDNGELYISDLNAELEPKKVWSRQSCHARILKLLDELPGAASEREKEIKAWWRKIVIWQEGFVSSCDLTRYWSNYCVHQMIDAWEEIHGAPNL